MGQTVGQNGGVKSSPLTRRQAEILDFISATRICQGRSPSFREIGAQFRVDHTSCRDVIAVLKRKGHLRKDGNGDLEPLTRQGAEIVEIPFYGRIPASPPSQIWPEDERISISAEILGSGRYFALRASGDSMSGAGIQNRDLLIVRAQETAEIGQFIVALVNGESTIKEYRVRDGQIELHPHHPEMKPIRISETDAFLIQGVVWLWLKNPPYRKD